MTNDERICPKGSIWADEHGEARVLATTEGYAVMRSFGRAPFLKPISEVVLSGKWRLVSAYPRKKCIG